MTLMEKLISAADLVKRARTTLTVGQSNQNASTPVNFGLECVRAERLFNKFAMQRGYASYRFTAQSCPIGECNVPCAGQHCGMLS